MRDIESIVKDVVKVYRESGNEAEEYLHKARQLRERFGPGLAIVYCWFYSVPQRWTQVEPTVFKLAKATNFFDLGMMLTISEETLAMMLRPMIFYNNISSQLKNFCKAGKDEYSSWDDFAKALSQEPVFTIFERLRKYKGARVTFKNLAAMKIFVGMDDNLIIIDSHVAKVLGINKSEASKCRVQEAHFKSLLERCGEITDRLRASGLDNTCLAKKQMYPAVCAWFKKMLEKKFKNAEICVEDTSKKILSKWLVGKGFHNFFPDYQTYEIEVDVTGIVKKFNEAYLGLVECKLGRITLRDLSQLLGYSKVALPLYSVILSPKGISRSMNLLFNISRRNGTCSAKHLHTTTTI